MERSAAVWLLCLLLLTALSCSQARVIQSYFRVGGALVLQPVPVPERITSVAWKHKDKPLAEWVEGKTELGYYGRFRGRSDLSTNTGVLQVRSMTAEDGGVFSVEINSKPQSQVYSVSQMDEVPQPHAFVTPLACSQAMTRCLLHCYGHAEDTENITYFWKMGDGEWEESEKKIEILNIYELHPVRTFSCRMKNPVGEKDSEPIGNPFYREKKTPDSGWTGVGGFVGGAFGAAVLVSAALFAFYMREFIRKSIKKLEGFRDISPTNL